MDPVGAMAALEEFYAHDRTAFLKEAIRSFDAPGDQSNCIALVAFLLKKKEVLPLLSDASTPLPSRIRLTRLALGVDSDLDNAITGEVLASQSVVQQRDLLEILGQTQSRLEVTTRLLSLLRHPSPPVHSKVAFLLTRVAPEGEWVSACLDDDDPRVRANALEALWRQKTEFARQAFRRGCDDVHHRVAANAIYGLYLLGDPEAPRMVRHLLANPDRRYRGAGLWLAEQTRDPRFIPSLAKLIGKVAADERSRCLRVMQAAKTRREESMKRGRLEVDWLHLPPGPSRLCLTREGERLTHLHPFDIVVSGRGQVTDDYQLQRREPDSPRSVILLAGECPDWSTGWLDALPAGVRAPGPDDRFGVVRYQRRPHAPAAAAAADSFRLLGVNVVDRRQASTPARAAAPSPPPQEIHWCGRGLYALRRAFDSRAGGLYGLQSAIVHALNLLKDEPRPRLIVLDQLGEFGAADADHEPASGYELDVITGQAHPGVDARCRATGGRLQVAQNVREAAQCLVQLYRYWHADYELLHGLETPVDALEIFSEKGYGQAMLGSTGLEGEMVGAQGLEPRASSV